jgi:glyoxylase-like metal-dependent hydrolase (beta-lactamase superfamily II)
MELVTRVIGPLQTNVHLVADPRTREAIAIDAAIPGLPWITGQLAARGWRLALIVSTHGHWDHAGENAALQAWSREAAAPETLGSGTRGAGGPTDAAPGSRAAPGPRVDEPSLAVVAADGRAHRPDPSGGAEIAAHPADWYRLLDPQPLFAPFPIPPCVPAAELTEGGAIRFGDVRLEVLHTPGHTEGSVCLVDRESGILFSGDTLFTGGWGRVDLPGGDRDAMVASLTRLATLPDGLRVLPGHGSATTIARERAWLEMVARERRLPL